MFGLVSPTDLSFPVPPPPGSPTIGILLTGLQPPPGLAEAGTTRGLFDPITLADFSAARLRHLTALVIPFRTHHGRLWDARAPLFDFLRRGGRVFVQADGPIPWLPGAIWEDRPNRNFWWVLSPEAVPVTDIDSGHPAYLGMRAPHERWHARGAYTQTPEGARVVQRNPSGEVLTWESRQSGGVLLVTTLDPLPEAEPGIQRLTPFDHYCDQLTGWLLDRRPEKKPRPIGKAVNLFAYADLDEADSKGI